MSVEIIYDKCLSCGACYNHCPNDVIGWDGEKKKPVVAYPDECSHCGVCALECRHGAIRHTIPLACYEDITAMAPSVNQPEEFNWQKWL
ncbi:MAG: ferredoxin family protein [Synergistaceae bacterium]|uniref:4Fe-4S dicluster domain-containing protein n=1 Tax=Cloacibacillus sp. TaxID=2049023 RepID=UPI0025B8C793|nr:ferredoxin family protein [Cloacibacillus sp.]MCC8057308.1 ferredoxin family protein [Cloacibacillus sp.]MCC8178185.1 ferredoxin family protein [Cloacibacillus sp.]MCD7952225.1 ferredoxin family protein [Synergistaceae bacterium]MCD8164551.1 ferredoxin family protein [Synergistaceae bacterium]